MGVRWRGMELDNWVKGEMRRRVVVWLVGGRSWGGDLLELSSFSRAV
jgi:hypothetical protein